MKGNQDPLRTAPPERTRFHLDGRSVALDRRIHAARGDLAGIESGRAGTDHRGVITVRLLDRIGTLTDEPEPVGDIG